MKSRHRGSGGCCLVIFGGRAHSIRQEGLCSRLKMLPVLHFNLLPLCVSYHPRESNTEGLSTSISQLFLRHVWILSNPSESLPSTHESSLVGHSTNWRTFQPTSRQASHYSITNAQDKGLTCCSAETYDCTMKWTACCTGFFGFLCCAKVLLSDETHIDSSLHLSLQDIRLVTFCFSGNLTFATKDPQLTSCA